MAAVKIRLVQCQRCDTTSVSGIIVGLCGSDAASTGGVELNGEVLCDGGWVDVVFNCDRCIACAHVAVVVGHSQSHSIGAYVGAIKVCFAQRH